MLSKPHISYMLNRKNHYYCDSVSCMLYTSELPYTVKCYTALASVHPLRFICMGCRYVIPFTGWFACRKRVGSLISSRKFAGCPFSFSVNFSYRLPIRTAKFGSFTILWKFCVLYFIRTLGYHLHRLFLAFSNKARCFWHHNIHQAQLVGY